MKKKLYFILAAILFLFSSCDVLVADHSYIYVKNDTEQYVVLYLGMQSKHLIPSYDSVCVEKGDFLFNRDKNTVVGEFFLYGDFDTALFKNLKGDTIQVHTIADTSDINSFFRLSNWQTVYNSGGVKKFTYTLR